MHTLTPIILSGGSGTRLWPLSREKHPKQLLALVNEDTLLQATIRRLDVLDGVKFREPIVVCNEEYRFLVAEQLRVMKKNGTILLESTGKNTAPALTLAALAAISYGDDPILLAMPSDHVVVDTHPFQTVVCKGAPIAAEGAIITFGITPDTPGTGYGFIKAGKVIGQDNDIFRIARFDEKPTREVAQTYLDDGAYLWNSGILMMRASVWLSAIEQCRPDILSVCQDAWEKQTIDGDFLRVNKLAFEQCPSESIDYAVLEKIAADDSQLPLGAVIRLSAGWSDVGQWDSLWQALPKDDAGNASQGDVLLEECRNTLAISEGRLVTCVGVEDLVVVETSDAILVANKNKTQDVKKIVDCLRREGRSEGQLHRKVFRPWGWYDSVDFGERFQVKRIVVNPGAALSLQMHHHRAEHWIVVRGTARVTCGDNTFLVTENQSTFIPLGARHRLENPGCVSLELIEVQSGSYLGEDDIVRFQDIYGREES